MDIDFIKKQFKERRKNLFSEVPKKISEKSSFKWGHYVVKVMILFILFLSVLIYTKSSTENKQLFYDFVFKNNISFAAINNFYNKYLGGILPFKNIVKDNEPVFKEKLTYSSSSIYKDGVALTVADSYLVPVLEGGIVVFVGEKEDYGKTVIVQQVDGVDVWYGNLNDINIQVYDYIEAGTLLGETVDSKLYLVFKKEGKVIDYKKYI